MSHTSLKDDIERSVALTTGQTIHLDYRSNLLKQRLTVPSPPNSTKPLKALTWNIERGYQLDHIIEELRNLDADIIALQEVDVGLSRSEYLETGVAIARELGLNYVYQCEFIELEGDIDKKYFYEKYYPQISSFEPDTASRSNNDVTQDKQYNSNRSFQLHISNALTSPLTRTDPEYQKDYRKSPNNVFTTGTHGHDTKVQFHPTPLEPSVNTIKFNEYFVHAPHTGTHGNAILTKFNISQIIPLNHQHHPYNWDRDGILLNEPRLGERQTLCCVIDVPNSYLASPIIDRSDQQSFAIDAADTSCILKTTPLAVYTCHLELFCGIIDRLKIFGEIMAHYKSTFYYPNKTFYHGIIMGDFNTLAHSIARFSPKYCKDQLRWKSLGYTEAEWWYKYVLDSYPSHGEELNHSLVNERLKNLNLGPLLTQIDYQNLVNVFDESFPPNTETLTNYSGYFYGKLDYILTSNVLTIAQVVTNMQYHASDHRGLMIECYLKGFEPTAINNIDSLMKNFPITNTNEANIDPKKSVVTYNSKQNVILSKHFVFKNQVEGYYSSNNCIFGYFRRNCTPFVIQILAFVLPAIFAIIFSFLTFGFSEPALPQ